MLFFLGGGENWNDRKSDFFFLLIGILVAFFDFLTYPLLTLGVPLVLFLSVMKRSEFAQQLLIVMRKSLVWLLGYAGMWGSKWVIGSIVCGNSFFDDVIRAISIRSSVSDISSFYSKEAAFLRLEAIWVNIKVFLKWPYLVLFLAISFVCLYLIKKKALHINLKRLPVYFLIALFPIVWFVVLANHSYEHPRLAYRELGVSVFSILWFITDCD